MEKVSGFLEVGPNDKNEVVINHPDLHPDENGVGHIVFSPNQARNLAELLIKHANSIDTDTSTPSIGRPLTDAEKEIVNQFIEHRKKQFKEEGPAKGLRSPD